MQHALTCSGSAKGAPGPEPATWTMTTRKCRPIEDRYGTSRRCERRVGARPRRCESSSGAMQTRTDRGQLREAVAAGVRAGGAEGLYNEDPRR